MVQQPALDLDDQAQRPRGEVDPVRVTAQARSLTIPALLAATERELRYRQRVYPRWVRDGRMPLDAAEHQLAAMIGIHGALKELQTRRRQVGCIGLAVHQPAGGEHQLSDAELARLVAEYVA